jgi:hypothetical protein
VTLGIRREGTQWIYDHCFDVGRANSEGEVRLAMGQNDEGAMETMGFDSSQTICDAVCEAGGMLSGRPAAVGVEPSLVDPRLEYPVSGN